MCGEYVIHCIYFEGKLISICKILTYCLALYFQFLEVIIIDIRAWIYKVIFKKHLTKMYLTKKKGNIAYSSIKIQLTNYSIPVN